ncbi:hypothetical protein GCM10027347_61400 [Larkinella harenae]
MANSQNLKPAKKGEVRNPNGRPKGTLNGATLAKKVIAHLAKEGIAPSAIEYLRELYGPRVDVIINKLKP